MLKKYGIQHILHESNQVQNAYIPIIWAVKNQKFRINIVERYCTGVQPAACTAFAIRVLTDFKRIWVYKTNHLSLFVLFLINKAIDVGNSTLIHNF